MMKEELQLLLKNLAKLINVKTIVTFAVIAVLCYMTVTQKDMNEVFTNIVTMVVTFFFARSLSAGDK